MKEQNSFLKGIKDGIPICLGYLSVSFAFGIFSIQNGLSILEAVLISMTCVTSAGQLAGVPIIATGGSLIELAVTQLIINLRYSLMSSSLSQKFSSKTPFFHRFLVSFGNTDEVFGVSASKPGKISPYFCYGLISISWLGWTLGTLLGAVSGNLLPAKVLSALGVALYGMFIAIIVPPATKSKGVLIAVILSAIISCVFYYVPILSKISTGMAVIISAVITALIVALVFPVKEEENE
jgi:predicted branched-subunit amino acid permease